MIIAVTSRKHHLWFCSRPDPYFSTVYKFQNVIFDYNTISIYLSLSLQDGRPTHRHQESHPRHRPQEIHPYTRPQSPHRLNDRKKARHSNHQETHHNSSTTKETHPSTHHSSKEEPPFRTQETTKPHPASRAAIVAHESHQRRWRSDIEHYVRGGGGRGQSCWRGGDGCWEWSCGCWEGRWSEVSSHHSSLHIPHITLCLRLIATSILPVHYTSVLEE